MVQEVERYFLYYWRNDKNCAVTREENVKIIRELPLEIQSAIFRDFLFKDFLAMFKVHFTLLKPPNMQIEGALPKYYEWADQVYSQFVIEFCQSLEPRFYDKGEYIMEEGDDVDEQIFVIDRDFREGF